MMNYFLIAFFFVRVVSNQRPFMYYFSASKVKFLEIVNTCVCVGKNSKRKSYTFCSKVEVYGNQFEACIWQYLCGWSGTFVASNKTAFVRYLDSLLTGRHCSKPLVQCQNINKPAGEISQHDVQPPGSFSVPIS